MRRANCVVLHPAGLYTKPDLDALVALRFWVRHRFCRSLLNTFIKPVAYAEIGYSERIAGKIEDPLEGVGFFGRPETILVLLIGGLTGFLWVAVILIAVCTNLSALQRIVYLYRRYS